MDELKLKNLQAMADSERLQKEDFLKQITQSIEILNNLEDRICVENGIPTKQHKPNDTLISVVRSLSINAVAIMAEMKRKTTKNGYDALKADYDKLVLERNAIQKPETILKEVTPSSPVDEIKNDPIEAKPGPKEERSDVDEINEILETHNKTSQEPVIETVSSRSASMDDQVLKLAGESDLYKLNDLIDLCTANIGVKDTEIKLAIERLELAELLSVERTTIKPKATGITYPALFRLTPKGLAKTNIEKVSEIDRWTQLAPGLRHKDIPLMVYAVDNYLPRHNYSFVSFFPKTIIDLPENPQSEFYPHIHLKNETQKDIYVLFGYETMNDTMFRSYLSACQILTNEPQYCLCVDGRIAKIFLSKVNFENKYNFSPNIVLNITNVGDWSTYDQMLKSGQPDTPKSIWFTSISNGK